MIFHLPFPINEFLVSTSLCLSPPRVLHEFRLILHNTTWVTPDLKQRRNVYTDLNSDATVNLGVRL